MEKRKFLAKGFTILIFTAWFITLLACSIVLTIIFNKNNESFGEYFLIALCWIITAFLLIFIIFNLWIAEINSNGILYYNLFPFVKAKRFFGWKEIVEIEIIKVIFFKAIYVSKAPFSYGHKIFISMKNDPNIIILNTSGKKVRKAIQQYYQKEIISGRNFRNTQN